MGEHPRQSPDIESSPERLAETERYPILNQALQHRYDRIAPEWDEEAYEGTRRDDLIPSIIAAAALRDGSKVLEAMCGTGQLIRAVRAQWPNVACCALDFSRGMLNAIADVSIQKVQASILSTPFADATFESVIIRSGLFDLPKRQQLGALREVRRILRSDGAFILQTYRTMPETHRLLNELVNLKDLLAGQYEDIGPEEHPRYFATTVELDAWCAAAGFDVEALQTFEGSIRYLRTAEMPTVGKAVWRNYVERLSDTDRASVALRMEPDGSLTYSFPGVLYRLRPR